MEETADNREKAVELLREATLLITDATFSPSSLRHLPGPGQSTAHREAPGTGRPSSNTNITAGSLNNNMGNVLGNL